MGTFYISNQSDLPQKYTKLENVNNEIKLDSNDDIIEGISSPNDFNWYFLRLVNGVNHIVTNSEHEINIKITYREPRRIIV